MLDTKYSYIRKKEGIMKAEEKKYCYKCDEEVEFDEKKTTELFNVKGCEVKATTKHLYCKKCGEEIYDADLERENAILVYDAYKEKNGLLTSKEIKEIRSKHNLSQKKLADLLKTGEKTITRYENGAIQDPAYDILLRLMQNDTGFLLLSHVYDAGFDSFKVNANLFSNECLETSNQIFKFIPSMKYQPNKFTQDLKENKNGKQFKCCQC